MERTNQPKPIKIVSAITRDGMLVETIQNGPEEKTVFAVSHDGSVSVQPDWSDDGIRYVPIAATHNLIRHKAIKLPPAPQEYESAEALIAEIAAYGSRYVALSPEFATVAATYVLLSWVYDAFNELPYLRFRGNYGSGKTRALIVFGSLAYKGFFASGASTVSPIFHTLDRFQGTLIFDEADFRFTDEKAELVKILNNGNIKGFSVLRTQVGPSKEFEPRAYSVFGPKIVAMRGAYQDKALESRFLTEEMSGRTLPPGLPISLPAEQEAEARALRAKLLMYRFRERFRVAVEPDLADSALEPRLNQILLPLLSIAPTVDVVETIWSYAERMQVGALADRSGSMEGQVLVVIAASMLAEKGSTLPIQGIVRDFEERFGNEYDRPVTSRQVSNIVRTRLSLPVYKTNGVMAVSLKDRDRLAAIFKYYGIADDEWKRTV
ncbi:MAG: hypothetical protein KIT25_03725 [Enhydrobacter sp.]|nr:MAG: hypothetical protein KIT25_03725 [Enhydrobacter sp.]